MKNYKVVNGMSFDENTPDTVCKILSDYYGKQVRLRLYYGDTVTGRCWMEEYDTIGYIGRSWGPNKAPFLIKTRNSDGGGAILDRCVIKITVGKHTLYKRPNFNMPSVTTDGEKVLFDGEIYANCKDEKQAARLAAFMRGERNCK